MCIRSDWCHSNSWSCLACAAFACLVLGCNRAQPSSHVTVTPAQSQDLRVLGQLPEFELIDQNGDRFGSEQLAGSVWVATFIFTSCTATCPEQSAALAGLREKLNAEGASHPVQFVSISVDPAIDTPQVLTAYGQRFDADFDQWHFLTGERAAIWELSKEGFKLPVDTAKADAASPIVHSQQFILVDRLARIRGYYDALSIKDRGRLLEDVRSLLAESTDDLPPAGAEATPATAPRSDDVRVRRQASNDVTNVYVPEGVRELSWMEDRAAEQRKTTPQFEVFYDFAFFDHREASGIRFKDHVVADVKKAFKQSHYDHGSGVAVADVDADGKLDIYFVSQFGKCELWRNKGSGQFEPVHQPPLSVDGPVAVGASFADVDNDGDADLFVTTVRGGNRLFENDGTGQFTDVTKRAGLDYSGHSSGSVFFDYDRDGNLDLLVTNVGVYTTDELGTGGYYISQPAAFAGHLKPERSEASILYRNLGGGRFENVNDSVGFHETSWSGDASPLDANQDGWPDIYLPSMQGHDEYYQNVEGRHFVKKSREVFPKTPWGAMGIEVFDFDRDGQFDIYITDMHTDMVDLLEPHEEKRKMSKNYPQRLLATDGNHVLGNALFQSQGANRYVEVSDEMGTENYWPWGITVADINADGFEDVFVASSMNYPFRYGVNSMLLNNRGQKFLDSEFILRIEPRQQGEIQPWFELDASGEDQEHPLAKPHAGKVVVWGTKGSRSSVAFDMDQDGDLDIVTNDFGGHPMVLVSNLSERKAINYLQIELEGSVSNRDGLGAIVELAVAGRRFREINDGKSGYLSQSRKPLYVGLDESNVVDEIVVRWPSGAIQTIRGPIDSNQTLRILEQAD